LDALPPDDARRAGLTPLCGSMACRQDERTC
jgi:hypothetical protein